MRVLLDTQALFWWFDNFPALSPKARHTIASAHNEVIVSASSVWELAIKTKIGKLNAQPLLDRLGECLTEQGFLNLPITLGHAVRAGLLAEHHKDPFDRMLVAQAQAENLPIISNDAIFDKYGVRRIW
ncbi:MAG: type II toxin-antitoxin system VapC family toxin [Terriglobales bacterium]